jgi:hypothetical protein
MNEVQCVIAGCSEVFRTEELVSKSARFACKNHPRDMQVRVGGRVYNPNTDEADKKEHFQSYQHDREMAGGAKPFGVRTYLATSPTKDVVTNLEEDRAIARIDEARRKRS